MKRKFILSTLVLSFTVMFTNITATTTTNATISYNSSDKIVFIGGDLNKKTLDSVTKLANDDESLTELKSILNSKITYSTDDSDIIFLDSIPSTYSINENEALTNNSEIAVNIALVRDDNNLQKYLQDSFKSGVKINMYGNDVSLEEYKELLAIDSLSITKINEDQTKFEVEYGSSDDEIITEKSKFLDKLSGNLKDNENIKKGVKKGVKNGIKETTKVAYNLVGYDIDSNDNKLIIANFNCYEKSNISNKYTKIDDISNEIFLSNILKSYYETKSKRNTQQYSIDYVGEAPAYIYSNAYSGNTLAGQTVTDWYMKRESSETSTTFDYMSIEDRTSYTGYNFYGVRDFWTDHDIPYIDYGDRITDWKPDQSNTSIHNISLSLGASGASLNYSFSTGSKFQVDDLGSRALSYGRWKGTSYDIIPPTDVKKWYPSTAWLSTGPTAVIDIRTKGGYVYKTPLATGPYSDMYVRCRVSGYGSNNY